MLRARCPKSSDHKKFVTVAHVAQDWLVDKNGNFLEEKETTDIVAHPMKGNTWSCAKCGEEAIVTDGSETFVSKG